MTFARKVIGCDVCACDRRKEKVLNGYAIYVKRIQIVRRICYTWSMYEYLARYPAVPPGIRKAAHMSQERCKLAHE